jgi:uncharacterized protein
MLKRFAAALLLAASTLPGMAADLPTHPFIHVSGSAEFHLMPDIGEIDIDIVSFDPDADAAWKLVTERLEASRALFAGHGVAADDVAVQDVVRRPRKADALPEGQPMPMETRVSLHVTVRDLAQWTPMLRALLIMKDHDSLAVSFNRSDRARVEADLLAQALGVARLKAQTIARSIGARLGPVTGVSPGSLKNLSHSMGMASDPDNRYTGDRHPPQNADMALVQALRLAQGVDVIYRIGGK